MYATKTKLWNRVAAVTGSSLDEDEIALIGIAAIIVVAIVAIRENNRRMRNIREKYGKQKNCSLRKDD